MKRMDVKKLVGLSSLLAIVIVLQLLSPYFKIGIISITLVLIPVVIGAIIYGISGGAILGGAFGIVVLIQCATGIDAGGAILFTNRPVITALLCIIKGVAAGASSGLVNSLLKNKIKNQMVAISLSAVIAPITNTLIFCACLPIFFYSTLVEWASGSNLLYYTIVVLVGWNFVVEFTLNAILSPVIMRIVNIRNKEFE